MMASLLTALLYIRFFNQDLTLTLLFVFVFVFCSVSNKLNTYFFFEFVLLIVVREGFFLHILHEFYEIKLNVMKYALNCVS